MDIDYSYAYLNELCKIIENQYFCNKIDTQRLSNQDCTPNIILGKKAHCDLIQTNVDQLIKLIGDQYLLIYSSTELEVKTTCRFYNGIVELKGAKLLQFDNCSITINNIVYDSKKLSHWDNAEFISKPFSEITNKSVIKRFHLEKLNEFTFKNMDDVQLLKDEDTNNKYYIFSIIGILLVIFAGFLCINFVQRSKQRKLQPKTRSQPRMNSHKDHAESTYHKDESVEPVVTDHAESPCTRTNRLW